MFATSLGFLWKDSTPRRAQEFLKLLWLLMVQFCIALPAKLTRVEAAEMADRAMLFKMSSKQLGSSQGLMPSFMAKPHPNLPGTSGHIHVSLVDQKTGKNVFSRDEPDKEAQWDDIKNLSDLGRYLYRASGLLGLTTAWPGFWKAFPMYVKT